MCCDLEVTDGRMTTAVKWVFAEPLVTGPPSLVGQRMGDRVFHGRALTQGGQATLRLKRGTSLLLAPLVLSDGQAPALPNPGFGALRTDRTRVTGTGRKRGAPPWDHRHELTLRARDGTVLEVQRAVGFGAQQPALRPGAGHEVHPLLRPLGAPRAGQVPQVNGQLQQTLSTLQLVGDLAHPVTSGFTMATNACGLIGARREVRYFSRLRMVCCADLAGKI